MTILVRQGRLSFFKKKRFQFLHIFFRSSSYYSDKRQQQKIGIRAKNTHREKKMGFEYMKILLFVSFENVLSLS